MLHDFLILNVRWFSYMIKNDNTSLSSYCAIRHHDKILHLLVGKKDLPFLYEALLYTGQIFNTVPRAEKFLKLYKSFECMDVHRTNADFRVIRHALSHPQSKLNNPKTISTLIKMLGTKDLDLNNSMHLKKFFFYFVQMLIQNDKELYRNVLQNLPQISKTKNEQLRNLQYVFK